MKPHAQRHRHHCHPRASAANSETAVAVATLGRSLASTVVNGVSILSSQASTSKLDEAISSLHWRGTMMRATLCTLAAVLFVTCAVAAVAQSRQMKEREE